MSLQILREQTFFRKLKKSAGEQSYFRAYAVHGSYLL